MTGAPPGPDRPGRARRLAIPGVAAAVVVADLLSKDWALDHLSGGRVRHVVGPTYLLLTYNRGAAFSLGTGITPIIEAVVILIVAALVFFSRRSGQNAGALAMTGVGLLLGGALGNLGDRVFRHLPGHPGAVVDFIQAVSWWPVFNVADAAIVVGVVLLILGWRSGPGARSAGPGRAPDA